MILRIPHDLGLSGRCRKCGYKTDTVAGPSLAPPRLNNLVCYEEVMVPGRGTYTRPPRQ